MMILGGAQVAQSLIGGFSGRKAAKKAAKRAKEIGRLQSEEFGRRVKEEQRLGVAEQKGMSDAQKKRRSLIEGMYATSGLLMTGTPAQALSEQEQADIANRAEAGAASESRVRSLQASAKIAALNTSIQVDAFKTQGQTAMMQAGFGGMEGLGSMYTPLKNWLGGQKKKGDTPVRADLLKGF
jgi:hypothetical protein